ncbi:unnamed protein product [Owenia fusiformis]|uniref:CD109 antigen n=1 Tax=Owenia fusiformis TaxID=6347 RepID=A0A8S4NQP4_OWEFU|nr:unnamed protein product [Owenia fusiformis]
MFGSVVSTITLFCVILYNPEGVQGQEVEITYKEPLRNQATYIIVAPRRFRPNQVFKIYATLLKREYENVHITAAIKNVDQRTEIASVTVRFERIGGRNIEIKVPEYVVPGNYSLYVEGKNIEGVGGALFHNETSILFDTKQMSVFIETDKAVYKQINRVRFRVIPVLPNLMPIQGTMDIFVRDQNGFVVRRWLAQAVNNGIVEKTFVIGRFNKRSPWSINVEAFGHTYSKDINGVFLLGDRMLVNVTMPKFIKLTDFGLGGYVKAYYYTSWIPVQGNGTIDIEVEGYPSSKFSIPINFFEDEHHFMLTINELRRATGVVDLSNKAIKVKAWVYDRKLHEMRWGEATTVVYDGGLELAFVEDKVRTFKPNMPFKLHVALKRRDGMRSTTAIEGSIELDVSYEIEGGGLRRQVERLPIADDNIVAYTLYPGSDDKMLTIKARYRGAGGNLPILRMTAYRVYSLHNYYINVQTSTLHPKVNRYMVFTIKTNAYVDTIYYHIVCSGNIIVSNQLHMTSLLKTISVAISRDMMPSARMVVYFIKKGEVVADSMSFYVEGTALHEVDVAINFGKDFGPSHVEVIGQTDPGTLVSFNALNYHLYTMGARNFITEEEILDELLTYDSHTNISASVSWYGDYGDKQTRFFQTQSYGSDANTTFVFAGLHVFTDADLTTVPSDCNATNGWLTCYDGSCYRVEKKCDQQVDCKDGADESGCIINKPEGRRWEFLRDFYMTIPYFENYEDQSWMWHTDYTKPSGKSFSLVVPPLQPAFYAISALSVSREKGLGVVQTPYRVDVTRSLYCSCEFPTMAKKGEQIGIAVFLSSFASYTMEVLVTLPSSKDYKFVSVGEGLISHYSPPLIGGDVQTLVLLSPGEKKFVHFPVLPLRKGRTRFSIFAQTFDTEEGCSGSIDVQMDGVTNTWHTPYFVDLVKFSQIIIPDLWIPVPERFVLPEQRQHLYVPGSVSTKVSIVGDVIGPAFFTSKLSVNNVVGPHLGIPVGMLEATFFEFSQNLWNLKYLKSTDQLTGSIQSDALEIMNRNFQEIMMYYQSGGGIALFWKGAGASVWLTALIVNQLKFARVSDWETQFFIPSEFMNEVALWLVSHQNKDVGCWKEIAPTYTRTMLPKLRTLNGREDYWNITLTAHLVIALSGNLGVTGAASTAVETARNKGADFLATTFQLLDDPFELAIVTYALHIAGHRSKSTFFAKLRNSKQEDAREQWPYWSNRVVEPINIEVIDVIPFMQPNEPFDMDTSSVMATSYALMCYVLDNYLEDASKIMYWIQSRRRRKAGWSGTIDTITALQALHTYGLRNPNRDIYSMELTVESTASPAWTKVIRLDRDNFNVEQEVEVPNAWGSVKVTARGNGLAMLQVTTTANVEYIEQLRAPAKTPDGIRRHFDLEVNLRWAGANNSIMYMTPCARWLRTDVGPTSMLAYFQIDIPSGFTIFRKELNKHMREYPFVRRNFFKRKSLIIYVDQIGTDWLCSTVRADRWYPVANGSIQHSAIVAEYYQPEIQNKTLYTTYNLFSQHICLVCGSFQCPYCPYYNSADQLVTSHWLTLTTILAGLHIFLYIHSLNGHS